MRRSINTTLSTSIHERDNAIAANAFDIERMLQSNGTESKPTFDQLQSIEHRDEPANNQIDSVPANQICAKIPIV